MSRPAILFTNFQKISPRLDERIPAAERENGKETRRSAPAADWNGRWRRSPRRLFLKKKKKKMKARHQSNNNNNSNKITAQTFFFKSKITS